jgi:sec-independent protein translocase protein TatB
MFFLFLESVGTTELFVILLVALVVFGPRKLPELGRSLGRSIGEFRRASEDFKRTWEMEVEAEQHEKTVKGERTTELEVTPAPLTPSLAEGTVARDAVAAAVRDDRSEMPREVVPILQPTASTALPVDDSTLAHGKPAQS